MSAIVATAVTPPPKESGGENHQTVVIVEIETLHQRLAGIGGARYGLLGFGIH